MSTETVSTARTG